MKLTNLFTPLALLTLLACQPQSGSTNNQAASNNSASVVSNSVAPNVGNILKTMDIRQDNIGKDFTLTRHDKQPFTLSDYKGQFVVLTFGFTNCPSICPTELYTYREALNQLDPEIAKNIAVVFVSVDPERDKPEIIGRYVQQFHPDFIGASDTSEHHQLIETIKQDWRIVAYKSEVKSEKIYNMDHTAGSYIIDKKGQTAYFIPFGIESNQLASDLKEILSN